MKINILLSIILFLFLFWEKIISSILRVALYFPVAITSSQDHEIRYYEQYNNCKIDNIKVITVDNCELDVLISRKKNMNKYIIYSHGNAGSIYNRFHMMKILNKFGNVVMYDYRGYGKSSGYPDELGTYQDILAIWNYLVNEIGIAPENITLYGESLGCAITSWLGDHLAEYKIYPNKIILCSGFSSLGDIIHDLTSLPISLFNGRYNTCKYLSNLDGTLPIYILHSEHDGLIPISHAHRNTCCNNCIFFEIGGTHNDPDFKDTLDKIFEMD
jgi:hypothetical protein